MASISGSRRVPESRSGGKVLRPRRTWSAKTPYDRPRTSNSNAQSPNWLSRFVFSPTRYIASGAGKLITSVFDLSSSPASSYSSSSSSSSDFRTEDEIGTFDDANDLPMQEDDILKKTGTSEGIDCSGKELQPLIGCSRNKVVIEQLLMQETYSREECDRLIKIIRSRVVDSATGENEGDRRPGEMLNRTLASDMPDLCSAAVMEARKWLKEKKLDSKSDLGHGSHSLNLVTSLQAFEDEGSPVDVARSYMQALPPWSSPPINRIKPSSPVGIKLCKEVTPSPISGNSRSSSKLKRDSLATGSWSVQDEMRRVRSRATEQMLSDLPSSKIDWSAFALANKSNVLPANGNIESSVGETVCNFTNSMNASLNSARELGTGVSLDLERKEDGAQPEAVLSDSVPINHDQNEGAEATKRNENEAVQDERREMTTSGQKPRLSNDMMTTVNSDLLKVDNIVDTNGPKAKPRQNSAEETKEASDSRLHDGNCSVLKDKVGAEDALANGSLSSEPSSHAEHAIDQSTTSLDKENNTAGSGHERIAKVVLEQEACELLSKTSTDVHDVNVNDTAAINGEGGGVIGSQNSSSVEYDPKLDNSGRASKPDLAATTYSIAKHRGKRITRNSGTDRSRVVK